MLMREGQHVMEACSAWGVCIAGRFSELLPRLRPICKRLLQSGSRVWRGCVPVPAQDLLAARMVHHTSPGEEKPSRVGHHFRGPQRQL